MRKQYSQPRDKQVDVIAEADRVDAYFLTTLDVPVVQDGYRDDEHLRCVVHVARGYTESKSHGLCHCFQNARQKLASAITNPMPISGMTTVTIPMS